MGTSVLDDTRRAPGGDVSDEPAFETRGIEYIPIAERRGGPLDLMWMWAGALFNVEYVVYGALIISFGLAFWQPVEAAAAPDDPGIDPGRDSRRHTAPAD